MLPEKIMQSDLLDILFENRNKNYGAYALRKSYNKILITSIGGTLLIAVLFTVVQSFHHSTREHIITIDIVSPDINPIKMLPDKQIQPPALHTQATSHFRQVNNSTPEIVPDNAADKTPLTTTDIEKAVIGPLTIDGKDDIGIIEPPAKSLKGKGSVITDTEKTIEDKPVEFAEIMPQFPGGTNALIKFILKNIHQPDDLQPGEEIKVIASLVVSKTGDVEDVKIVSSGRPDLDKEVLRVINKMPVWKPGIQNGKPISVYFNLPVTFQTANE